MFHVIVPRPRVLYRSVSYRYQEQETPRFFKYKIAEDYHPPILLYIIVVIMIWYSITLIKPYVDNGSLQGAANGQEKLGASPLLQGD